MTMPFFKHYCHQKSIFKMVEDVSKVHCPNSKLKWMISTMKRAESHKRKAEPSKAKENLNKAIEIFKDCGADGWVEKYE